MEHLDFIDHLRADGRELIDAARGALDLHVPSCPDWNMRDLVEHVGIVHRHKTAVLRSRSLERSVEDIPFPEDDGELYRWYEEGLGELAVELSTIDPETPVWTWDGTNRAGFWSRRMAHETAVHRWDAQNAAGAGEPIDDELAADGVDEILLVHFPPPEALEEGEEYVGGTATVNVVATDGAGEWTIVLEPPAPFAERDAVSEPDLLVSGGASDLLLFLWRRIAADAVDVKGDDKALDDLWEWLGLVGE